MKNCSYQPGDLVFLYNPALKPGEAAKFHRYWKEPYVVLERVTEVNYKIRKLDGSRATVQVVHFNNLKLFRHKETAADSKTSSSGKIMNGDDGGESEGDFDDLGEDVVFPQPSSVHFEPTNEPEPESRELEAEISCDNEQEREISMSADPDMSNVEDLETGGNELPHSDRGSDQEEQMEIVNECDERVETDDDDCDEKGNATKPETTKQI